MTESEIVDRGLTFVSEFMGEDRCSLNRLYAEALAREIARLRATVDQQACDLARWTEAEAHLERWQEVEARWQVREAELQATVEQQAAEIAQFQKGGTHDAGAPRANVGDPALAGTGVAPDGESTDVAVQVTLQRYGIQHFRLDEPICRPMPDGYWTPWYVAADVIARLRAQVDQQAAEIQRLTAIQEGARQVWQEERATLEAALIFQRERADKWAGVAERQGAVLADQPTPADLERALEHAKAAQRLENWEEGAAEWAEARRLAGLETTTEKDDQGSSGSSKSPEADTEALSDSLLRVTDWQPIATVDRLAPPAIHGLPFGTCFRGCLHTKDRHLCADNSGLMITRCLCDCHADTPTGGSNEAHPYLSSSTEAGTGQAEVGEAAQGALGGPAASTPRVEEAGVTLPPSPVPVRTTTDRRARAEQLLEEIGGGLCVCQSADVPHWCENCQHKIDIISAALGVPNAQLDTLTRERDEACAALDQWARTHDTIGMALQAHQATITTLREQLTASDTARRTAEQERDEARTTVTRFQRERKIEEMAHVVAHRDFVQQLGEARAQLREARQERDTAIALQAGAERAAVLNAEACARLAQQRDTARAEAHTALLEQVLAVVDAFYHQTPYPSRLRAELAALRQS